jgi:diaminohydroxyphosphoribosylaminopyrimidine deaminase/5-amino-6-(5-phosphoribosylamino)uracil reductase
MNSFSAADTEFMALALQLAARGRATARPNPAVGCVVVDAHGEIAGQGWHERAGGPHAEVVALAEAGARANGSTVYVTLEPCSHHGRTPPCTDQLIAASVSAVVYAVEDPNPSVAGKGAEALRGAGISVTSGLLAADAADLNKGFFARMQRGRPWLRSKIAVSLDGRTALRNGVSQWITSSAARADVHRWRALSGAVLTGIGTVLADDPSLTARNADELVRDQPIRVVLDSELNTPVDAKLFKHGGPIMIFHGQGVGDGAVRLAGAGAETIAVAAENGALDLVAVLKALADREINDVWVEAGATLNGALLAGGLIDELIVYQAASVLGNQSRAMFNLPELSSMSERPEFTLREVRKVGDDLRLCYVPRAH